MSYGNGSPRLGISSQELRLGLTYPLVTVPAISDGSFWSLAKASVKKNATTAPDGYSMVDLWVPDTGVTWGPGQAIAHTVGGSLAGKKIVRYVKPLGNTTSANFAIQNGAGIGASFNLGTKGVTPFGTGAVADVVDLGNGWLQLTVNFPETATMAASDYSYLASAGAGDGSSGVYIWPGPTTLPPATTAASTAPMEVDVAPAGPRKIPWGKVAIGGGLVYAILRK